MLFKTWDKNSIATIVFGLLLISTISAYMVGRQPQMLFDVQLFSLYIAILLCLLLYSTRCFSNLSGITFWDVSITRLKKVEYITSIIGILSILLYLYILSKVFELLLLDQITVQEHKNEGGASDMFNTLVPHIFITIGNFFSPFGYFFLSLHFYYLVNKKLKRSLLFLLLSLLIILNGLIALSRSATVSYLLCYLAILYFVFPVLEKKMKRAFVVFGSVVGCVIFSALLIISDSRFSEYYTKSSKNDAILDEKENPVLFSVFDYFSQWEEAGPMMLQRYHWGDQSWSLYNSNGLGVQIQKIMYGASYVNEAREKKYDKLIGDDIVSGFHGLIARGVFDYGFFGNFIFILVIVYCARRIAPHKNALNFKTILFLPVILPVIVNFWSGNALSGLSYDLAIIYNIVIWKYLKRNSRRLNNGIMLQSNPAINSVS